MTPASEAKCVVGAVGNCGYTDSSQKDECAPCLENKGTHSIPARRINALLPTRSEPATSAGVVMSEPGGALGRDREVIGDSPTTIAEKRLHDAYVKRFTLREEVQRRYYPTPKAPLEQKVKMEGWERGWDVKTCGTKVVPEKGWAGVTITGTKILNVKRCNKHFCVVCSHKRCTEDSIRMKECMEEAHKQGYKFAFVTLTIPTHSSIEEQVYVLNNALSRWKVLLREWVRKARNKARYGGIYISHSWDVTFRHHGDATHLHFHCLVMAKENTGIPFEAFWTQAVDDTTEGMAFHPYHLHHDACLVKPISTEDTGSYANYFAKYNGIANEVIGGESKYETKDTNNYSLQDLIESLAISSPGKRHVAIYKEFYKQLEVNRVRWREVSKKLSTILKGKEEEEEPNGEEEEEELSINVTGYSWSVISRIKGARERIQRELRKEASQSDGTEDLAAEWSSKLLGDIERTNERLKEHYGELTAPNSHSNNFWDDVDKQWEDVFGSLSRRWGSPHPLE